MIAEIENLPNISIREQKDRLLTLELGKRLRCSGIIALLASRGVGIEQVRTQEASLEEMYTTILKDAE